MTINTIFLLKHNALILKYLLQSLIGLLYAEPTFSLLICHGFWLGFQHDATEDINSLFTLFETLLHSRCLWASMSILSHHSHLFWLKYPFICFLWYFSCFGDFLSWCFSFVFSPVNLVCPNQSYITPGIHFVLAIYIQTVNINSAVKPYIKIPHVLLCIRA